MKISEIFFLYLFTIPGLLSAAPIYTWLAQLDDQTNSNQNHNALQYQIAAPEGFRRTMINKDSYAEFLRYLPLKTGKQKVYLYNGQLKQNQTAQYAVIDIDTGKRNLQQCADAIMRLRAEYLFSVRQYDKISFNFTDGVPASYNKWRQGFRPVISKRNTVWRKNSRINTSYLSFRNYLNTVFAYAGTWSLSKESKSVPIENMLIGDFFIKGGFPGHAVLVVDIVQHPVTKEKRFLLAQSYMPAQDMHILNNPGSHSPWYKIPANLLQTPEWKFRINSLKRLK